MTFAKQLLDFIFSQYGTTSETLTGVVFNEGSHRVQNDPGLALPMKIIRQ